MDSGTLEYRGQLKSPWMFNNLICLLVKLWHVMSFKLIWFLWLVFDWIQIEYQELRTCCLSIRLLVDIFTGNCVIERLFPLDEEKVEYMQHLLYHCPALRWRRFLFLYIEKFRMIQGFGKSTDWFDGERNVNSSK